MTEFRDLANIEINISKTVREVHPVVRDLIYGLARLEFIHQIRVLPEFLQASNKVKQGRIKIPITQPDHPNDIGLSLILDIPYKNVQFYEITSARIGCGAKMVDAVLTVPPEDWTGLVLMDWSGGFWQKMQKRYKNLEIY